MWFSTPGKPAVPPRQLVYDIWKGSRVHPVITIHRRLEGGLTHVSHRWVQPAQPIVHRHIHILLVIAPSLNGRLKNLISFVRRGSPSNLLF